MLRDGRVLAIVQEAHSPRWAMMEGELSQWSWRGGVNQATVSFLLLSGCFPGTCICKQSRFLGQAGSGLRTGEAAEDLQRFGLLSGDGLPEAPQGSAGSRWQH